MMQEYTVRKRNVNGLEISYAEYQVVIIDRDSLDERILKVVASFIHEACAVGLCEQLQEAYGRGVDDALSQAPAQPDDWKSLMAEAHQSLNRLEHLAAQALVASLEETPDHVDVGDTRVHLLADKLTAKEQRVELAQALMKDTGLNCYGVDGPIEEVFEPKADEAPIWNPQVTPRPRPAAPPPPWRHKEDD